MSHHLKSDFFSVSRENNALFEEIYLYGNSSEDLLHNFLFSENQSNNEWIIMETNSSSVWWPWLIEAIDGWLHALKNSGIQNQLIDTLRAIDVHSMYENTTWYFANYLESVRLQKKKKHVIIMHNGGTTLHEDKLKENIHVSNKNIRYIGRKDIEDLIRNNPSYIQDAILVNYWFGEMMFKNRKLYQTLKDMCNDAFIDSTPRHDYVNSKVWQKVAAPNIHFWDRYNSEAIKAIIADGDTTQLKELKKQYIAKEYFSHGGHGIHFPWSRDFTPEWLLSVAWKKNALEGFFLQKYYQLPRKLTIQNNNITYGTVDIRAYVTLNHLSHRIDVQIFWREGSTSGIANVSSGWTFVKAITVPDLQYTPLQKSIITSLHSLSPKQINTITTAMKEYAHEKIDITPGAQISPIPFILSESWQKRIENMVRTWLDYAVSETLIYQNTEWHLDGVTLFGLDIAVNPLPIAQ